MKEKYPPCSGWWKSAKRRSVIVQRLIAGRVEDGR